MFKKFLIFSLILAKLICKTPANDVEKKFGIDVSAYDGKIDWEKVSKAGVKFAILRGTVKDTTLDSYFEYNYNQALAHGIEVSVYHYSYALSVEKAMWDAKNLIEKLNGKKVPIYLDLEWDDQGELERDEVTNIAIGFIKTILSYGYECHVYSNINWYKKHYYYSELQKLGAELWIASWGENTGEYIEDEKPNLGERIWQYTSRGKVDGIDSLVDLNMRYSRTTQ